MMAVLTTIRLRHALPGDRRINSKGYIEVKIAPDDFFAPMADVRGYVLEHRLLMAKHLEESRNGIVFARA